MKVLLFSGTTEGRELSEKLLAEGHEVTVSVATPYGEEEQAKVPGALIETGRKDLSGMKELLKGKDLCVDATHPYAVDATATIKQAAEDAGVPFVRIARTLSEDSGEHTFSKVSDIVEYLKQKEGNILVATGTKELPGFRDLPPERLFPRVLPSVENIEACEALSIPHRNIVAMQGPFSAELNAAVIRQKQIAFTVTKNGGATGGFPEKVEAARATGTELLVLQPPEDEGMDIETFLQTLRQRNHL